MAVKIIYGEEKFLVNREVSLFRKAAEKAGSYLEEREEITQEIINLGVPNILFSRAVLIRLKSAKDIPWNNLDFEDAGNILIVLSLNLQ